MTEEEQDEYHRFCLYTLEGWLEKDDVIVEFGGKGGSYYFYDDRLIVISTKQSLESQVYCLLHEAGHHTLRKIESPRWVQKSISSCKRKADRVDVVREEVLAWEKAEEIAKELNLWSGVNEHRWNKYVRTQLYDYMKWAINFRQNGKRLWQAKK